MEVGEEDRLGPSGEELEEEDPEEEVEAEAGAKGEAKPQHPLVATLG